MLSVLQLFEVEFLDYCKSRMPFGSLMFGNMDYDFDLIKQDIINQFSVRKNERVMNPEFGTIIWDCIYDPFTEDLKTEIANDITRIVGSDPRVNATEVNITEQDFGMILEITLEYVNTDQTEVMSLTFDKSLGLSVQ